MYIFCCCLVYATSPKELCIPECGKNKEQTLDKRRTVKKEMSDVEEVRRVFGDPCPSTVRVKILVGEVRNLKCTGAVLKRLMVDVPPPAKVRSFSVRSTIARRF